MNDLAQTILQQLARHPAHSTWVLIVVAVIVMGLLHLLTRTLNTGRYAWQKRLRAWLGVGAGKRIGELSWLIWTLHFLLWPLVIYVLLHIWGLRDEARQWVRALYSTGVEIGGLRIVLGKLLIGVMLFAVLYTFTRWLKRKLETEWLLHTAIEPGTRDSVATVFGHVTFAFAAMIGLSYAGVDLGKLAIVAGALSVGIGFGLQNIVSNFVSGLILLFERPVQSGDFVTVGQTQGTVRKMRIRATEIETPDHETVIVPNSDLLSTHLRNRNLRSRYGRAVLQVGVACDSDPQHVSRVLIDVANAHASVVKKGQPPGGPAVSFAGFGANAFQFELAVQVVQADKAGEIASDLRFAIIEAFRHEGIEMPFPQQDVHLRSVPASLARTGEN